MKDKDASEFDELLNAFAHADRLARIAASDRQAARIACVRWVERYSVPAGTLDGALDIPAFLRSDETRGQPQYPHAASLAPIVGCGCDYCTAARSRATLGL